MKFLQSKKSKFIANALSIAFLAYASTVFYNNVITPTVKYNKVIESKSMKADLGNYNKEMVDKGYESVEVDESKPNVFLIEVQGDFVPQLMFYFENKVEQLAINAKKGDVVYISIMSAGGSAAVCSKMAYDIDLVSDEIGLKTVSVVDHLAASCGYYLAASSDEIVMSKSAYVGNIGTIRSYKEAVNANRVVGAVVGAVSNKEQYQVKSIGSTRVKELLGGAPVENSDDLQVIKSLLDMRSDQFFGYVLEARGERLKDKERAFSGYYYFFDDAMEIGLVDRDGSIDGELRKLYKSGHQITKL